MLSLARIRLLGASLFLLWSLPASAQIGETVFDPNGDTVTAALSGTDCGLDRCTDYEWLLTASAGTLHQHFATLEFGFVNREPCAVSAPPPGSRVHSRQRSDCPGGTIAIYERLDTSTLSGPDYGLKRLRMCTDDGYGLEGVEAEFFKLPHLGRNGPGQEAVTRRFERSGCTRWRDWSACPLGYAADQVRVHTETINAGGIQGLELRCREVIPYSLR